MIATRNEGISLKTYPVCREFVHYHKRHRKDTDEHTVYGKSSNSTAIGILCSRVLSAVGPRVERVLHAEILRVLHCQ